MAFLRFLLVRMPESNRESAFMNMNYELMGNPDLRWERAGSCFAGALT